jgi:agmatinase
MRQHGCTSSLSLRALPVFVQLSSERARQAVRQDSSFARKQESPPALLVVVRSERDLTACRDNRNQMRKPRCAGVVAGHAPECRAAWNDQRRMVPHRPIDPVSVPSVTMDAMVLPELPFLGCPVVGELTQLDADVVVLGIPHAVSYVVDEEEQRGLATARAAVRKASQQFTDDLMHHDFDLGHAFLREEGPRLVDVGDVPFAFGAGAENMRRADEGLAQIVRQGVMPLVIGGDDSIPPIIARALANHGTFDVVTIDAHLDFRDEIDGERFGRSSPARRMSELAQVTSVTQIGLRGIGSSRTSELEDARAAEHRVITAAEVHERGQRWLCDQLPSGRDVFVSIDCDGLDPSVAPGTGWPQPGGLTFRHVAAVIAELARTSRIAGGDVVELLPSRDVNGLTALTAARLLMLLADSRGQAARDAS